MGKISHGWAMSKMSLRVITKNKKLLLFPMISGLIMVGILASLVSAMFITDTLFEPTAVSIALWAVFYFVSFFVSIFFNVALVACAMKELDGESTSLSYGIRQAAGRIKQIVAWALLAATVGLILRALEERAGFLGQIVLGLIGAAWSVATYFVVPVIAFEGLGPVEAMKRSLRMLKSSWGEMFVSNIGIGLIFFLLAMVGIIPLVLAFVLGGMSALLFALVAVAVYWIAIAVLAMSASGVLLAALYRYATTGKVAEGFPEKVIRNPASP